MIDEKKVILMTKCAQYEQKKGREEIAVSKYFKKDYIHFNILKTLVSVFVSCILLFAIYLSCNSEKLFVDLNVLHYQKYLIGFGIFVIVLLLFYYIIAKILYNHRFEVARKNVTLYYRNLKMLKMLDEKDEDNRPKTFDEGGNITQNDEFIDY